MLASPKPLWDNCLAVIRDAVKPDQYKTWFEVHRLRVVQTGYEDFVA